MELFWCKAFPSVEFGSTRVEGLCFPNLCLPAGCHTGDSISGLRNCYLEVIMLKLYESFPKTTAALANQLGQSKSI